MEKLWQTYLLHVTKYSFIKHARSQPNAPFLTHFMPLVPFYIPWKHQIYFSLILVSYTVLTVFRLVLRLISKLLTLRNFSPQYHLVCWLWVREVENKVHSSLIKVDKFLTAVSSNVPEKIMAMFSYSLLAMGIFLFKVRSVNPFIYYDEAWSNIL